MKIVPQSDLPAFFQTSRALNDYCELDLSGYQNKIYLAFQGALELTESLSEAIVVVWPSGGWQTSEAYMMVEYEGLWYSKVRAYVAECQTEDYGLGAGPVKQRHEQHDSTSWR